MSVSSDPRSLAGLPRAPLRIASRGGRVVPGLAAAAAVAAVALPLGGLAPRIGAPIIALALGMAIATVVPSAGINGLAPTSRYSLQVAIVMLGATISLPEVARVGVSSLPVMLGSLAAALISASVIGRRLGVPERLRVLIGVGTGICGASAIATVSGAIDARASEIRYAVSTIFAFNLAAVLLFPMLGHLLGLSSHAFGLWSGTAVNDTSSVVAAGFAYSHAAGTYAVIVKLTRTTMIIPIALFLASRTLRARGADAGTTGDTTIAAPVSLRRVMPWFLIWFLLASAANSLGLFGHAAITGFSHVGLALTTVALGAVGLSSNLGELRRAGTRPLALGALVWATVAVTSLALQALTGSL
ncbi:MAG TPA: putative sulfate exporter family transporter [Solirubrobacteraceae bacterium]|nr:putative sulfate exporter family transporter [Solirubrobacteraceae bacterium]